ncbi:MAG: DUF4058 family protein [Anaerolineae bacterium]|nr:DUF4058 family protein [Anaerolineae bacterium]
MIAENDKMRQNLFIGVHPYINSWLQTPSDTEGLSGWGAFHASHVVIIAEVIQSVLPEHYVAFAEQSIQLTGWDWDSGQVERPRKPDVTILQSRPSSGFTGLQNAPTPTMVFDLDEPEEFPEPMKRVVIREFRDGRIGRPVTAIELLSPTNKLPKSDYYHYQRKRQEVIISGVSLVEIDYLHESRPIIAQIPHYPDQPNSHPYYILVTDVRPTQFRKTANVFAFGLDEPIPHIPIPLAGDESVILDLMQAYQLTLARGAWLRLVDSMIEADYHTARFDTYHPKDQAWILNQMKGFTS